MKPGSKFAMAKASLNIISGISMITLICFGVSYLQFQNAFVFHDIKIEITNNPVSVNDDINFMMIGSKRHECNSKRVYGEAYSANREVVVTLDKFSKQYVHNTSIGKEIPNQWSMIKPKYMEPGEWRVSMTGDFDCNYLIFTAEKSQTYDNILLVIE